MTALSPCAGAGESGTPCTSLRSFYGFDRVPPSSRGRAAGGVERRGERKTTPPEVDGIERHCLGVADGVGDEQITNQISVIKSLLGSASG